MIAMATWWPVRRRVGVLALGAATLTAAAGALLGGSLYGAAAYVVVAGAALLWPVAITAQVILGQLLAGSALLGPGTPEPWFLLPVVAGVVVTAELLAVVARLDTPVERDPRNDLYGAGRAAVLGGVVFGVVEWTGGLPGPSGVVAIAVASAACVALAVLLARDAG